jgi:hypothetical protein
MSGKVLGPIGQQQKNEREARSYERLKEWFAQRPTFDPDGDTFAARGFDPRLDDPRVKAVHEYLSEAGAGTLAIGVVETLIDEGWLPAFAEFNRTAIAERLEAIADKYGSAAHPYRMAYEHAAAIVRGEC